MCYINLGSAKGNAPRWQSISKAIESFRNSFLRLVECADPVGCILRAENRAVASDSLDLEGHDPHGAGIHNLLPLLSRYPHSLNRVCQAHARVQQPLPPRMNLPPCRRHFEQEAVVSEKVGDLSIGVGAPVGAEWAP